MRKAGDHVAAVDWKNVNVHHRRHCRATTTIRVDMSTFEYEPMHPLPQRCVQEEECYCNVDLVWTMFVDAQDNINRNPFLCDPTRRVSNNLISIRFGSNVRFIYRRAVEAVCGCCFCLICFEQLFCSRSICIATKNFLCSFGGMRMSDAGRSMSYRLFGVCCHSDRGVERASSFDMRPILENLMSWNSFDRFEVVLFSIQKKFCRKHFVNIKSINSIERSELLSIWWLIYCIL